MIASIEQQEELRNRADKDGYPLMNPFVVGIEDYPIIQELIISDTQIENVELRPEQFYLR